MSFRKELKERRVIPLVGLYLGASWVGVEFLGFLTDRYLLSPYLIDLVLLTLGAMLPSVLALAWTHGKPGRDEWTRLEQVVVPVNVLLVASMLVIVFQGKELGGTTRVVTAEDETGARIERVIPKASFRKQVALYFFANVSGLPEAEWVTRWVPQAIYLDLIQDFYFDNRSPFQLASAMTDAGAQLGIAPLALQREIARQLHLPYFLAGEVQAVAPFAVESRLYQTRRGRLLASHRYRGDDLGAIIDRMSVGIKEDLEIAATDIEEAEDLPVSAISSEDPRALASYVDGMMQLRFHRDWQAAARSLTRAVELDASFALAQYYLYQANLLLGNESANAIDAAMGYLYKVPERLQGAIKEVYYTWRGEPEKALAALRLDVTLFPHDVIAHRRLANFYRKTAFYPEALKQFELIQELHPGDDLVLRDIAGIRGALGHFKQAVASLRAYLGNNPRDVEALLELGEIYQLLGHTANAEEVYERAALLGPQAARVMVQRADLHFQTGAYRQALALALEAADAAPSLEVRLRALNELAGHYEALGRIKAAMQVARRATSGERKMYGPAGSAIVRLKRFSMFARTTLADSAEAMLAEVDIPLPGPWNQVLDIMRIYYRVSREGTVISAEESSRAEAFYREYKLLVDVPGELLAAHIQESNGEYRRAIQSYIATLSRYPKRLKVQRYVARCYRKMGDGVAAMATIDQLLAVYPHDPAALYERYQILRRIDEALAGETLQRLGEIWAEADRVYLPAQEVRAALGALASP